LPKNSRVNAALGVLWSVPVRVVLLPELVADVRTGNAWLWLSPLSRWMPRPALSWMELPRTASPVAAGPNWFDRVTPSPPLKAMVLPAPVAVPPTALPGEFPIRTPPS
jgi:hypothetical protein